MPAMPDRTVTIANGDTASAAFGTGQATRGSFQLPGTMTGTNITVGVSFDGTNWTNCPVEGNEANPITPTAANGNYSLPVKAFSFKYFRLVSNLAEGAARIINIFTRD